MPLMPLKTFTHIRHHQTIIILQSFRCQANSQKIEKNPLLDVMSSCVVDSQLNNCSVIIISDSRLVSFLEPLTTSNRSALFSFLWQARRLDDLKKLRKCQDATSWRFRDFRLDVFVFNYQLMSKYLRETIKSSG